MTKRGKILRDTNVGPGLLTVEGKQYSFQLEGMWTSDVPPRIGMPVDANFTLDGALETVQAVSETQIAKETAQKAFSGALRQSESMRSGMQGRFSVVMLVVEAVMLLAFFALPNLNIDNSFNSRNMSGWDAIGLNPRTSMATDHGFLSLLAIVCLFAPLAVPILQQWWSRWLYAAPFAFAVLAFLTLATQIHNAAEAASAAMGDALGSAAAQAMNARVSGMFSVAAGAWIVLLCSLVLAWRAVKSPA